MLKKYTTTDKTAKLVGTIPSGFKSGDSDAEMLIVEPLVEHPEIKGLYRAVDSETNWMGWVEYTLPPKEPAPAAIVTDRDTYEEKLGELSNKKILVDLGVIPDSDLEILRQEVRVLATTLGEI